ncbi:hypothetical protein OV203_11865 [Nannocystis sp. ILAH1]|uniref:hypothetical protein n=1 Tax=unclassified Nannocystis TaxID=2627009 RepID=UPI00226F55B7|nr:MULTISPECIES: hypothetical protein [unclassified Nannocystis]MCY0987824.1 hypothetical protein [Nannocystis sp. ILAH1]MCY1070372.1 hypothetical protein [Nannocystis sp. RBIL2]
MQISLNQLMAWTMVLALPACPGGGKETGEPGETEGGATAGETEGPATEGPATEGPATEGQATEGPATEGSETEGETETEGPVTAGETETEGPTTVGESEGETEGESPAECEQADPAADAAFELVFKDWDEDNFFTFEYDVQCVVDAVTVADAAVTTAMTCEVDGVSEPASLRFAVAPEGAVDWDPGLAVRLKVEQDYDFAAKRIVQLRAAQDDAILAVVTSGGMDNNSGYPEAFLPLIYGYSLVCEGAGDTGGDGTPAQIDLSDPGKAELHLISHHRGSLPIDAEHAYAVDAGQVGNDGSPHYPLWQEVLLRRVRVGE